MEILIGLVAPFAGGYILGKTMPQVSGWAWGALAGVILSYLLIYDNVYLWASMRTDYSAQVLNQTRLYTTIFGAAIIGFATALGVGLGKKKAGG